jgi:hypothetical protein
MKKLLAAAALALVSLGLGGSVASAGDANDFLVSKVEARLYGQIVPTGFQANELGQPGNGVGPGSQGRQDTFCGPFGEAGRGVFDKDISCDDPFSPDNEMGIAVDPAKPNLLLAGSNDYQLQFVGNTLVEQVPSGFFLSQDGGGTWLNGALPMKGSLGGGDPVPGFDAKRNRLVFASLSFVCGQFAPVCSRGNIEWATSDISKLTGSSSDTVQWSDQTIVDGRGSDAAAQQIFSDKEWLAVDNYPTITKLDTQGNRVTVPNPNYGNYYVTYSRFRTESGRYDESPIWFTRSTDGGQHWSLPAEISGRNPGFCTFQDDPNDPDTSAQGGNSSQANSEGPDDPNACDQDQFSIPAVAPDGTLYVKFDNEQNSQAYEPPQRYDSQILLVKSTDGGQTFEGEAPTTANQAGCVRVEGAAPGTPHTGYQNPCIVPTHIVNEEDSYDTTDHPELGGSAIPDYPLNVSGRTTLTGNQFRVNSSGNLFIAHRQGDLSSKYRLFVTFADNIDGVRPGPGQTTATDPTFVPVTNTQAFYAYSDGQGAFGTWNGGDTFGNSNPATRLSASGPEPDDQFYLWGDANPVTGAVSIGYMNSDPARTGGNPGDYVFDVTTAANGADGAPPVFGPAVTESSQPSHPNSSRFFRARVDSCGDCATFIGDYNGLAIGSDGTIHSVWTDMRRPLAFVSRTNPLQPCGVPLSTDTATSGLCPLFGQDAFYGRIPPPTP